MPTVKFVLVKAVPGALSIIASAEDIEELKEVQEKAIEQEPYELYKKV